MANTLPNAILVGVQKGGTTALFNWLSQHPDVFGDPAMKDFPFFCTDGFWNNGRDWFAERFSGHTNEQVILHGYVNYLALGRPSAELIHATNPDAKVFVVIRNPGERAYSAYLQAKRMGREPADSFSAALDNEQRKSNRPFVERMDRSYVGHGFYSKRLEEFIDVFGADNMRIFLFDDINNRPQEICAELFTFFGVDPTFEPAITRKNDYAEPRFLVLREFINRGIPIAWLRDLFPINLRIRLRRYLQEKNMVVASKPALDPEIAAMLQKTYAGEIDRLEVLLGRNLDRWRNWPDPSL